MTGNNQTRLGTAQFKFKSTKLSNHDSEEALFTTSVESIYSTSEHKTNPSVKKRKLAVESLLNNYFTSSGVLQILFVFPHDDELFPHVTKKGDLIVVLDRFYSPDLLSKQVWDFLEELKRKLS